jgi:hypothetical protein
MDNERKQRIAQLPTKSLSELRQRFCDTWRRQKSDEEFMKFMRDITADKDHLPHNHRLNHCRHFWLLKPGDDWYEINTDTMYRLTE